MYGLHVTLRAFAFLHCQHLPPIVFDKTPDHAIGSGAEFANVSENGMQPQKESHQFRDTAMKKTVGQHEVHWCIYGDNKILNKIRR